MSEITPERIRQLRRACDMWDEEGCHAVITTDTLRVLLNAAERRLLPEGWQAVPIHMTPVMQDAVARNKLRRMEERYPRGPHFATLEDWLTALNHAPELPGVEDD